jgi:hypothetical protein
MRTGPRRPIEHALAQTPSEAIKVVGAFYCSEFGPSAQIEAGQVTLAADDQGRGLFMTAAALLMRAAGRPAAEPILSRAAELTLINSLRRGRPSLAAPTLMQRWSQRWAWPIFCASANPTPAAPVHLAGRPGILIAFFSAAAVGTCRLAALRWPAQSSETRLYADLDRGRGPSRGRDRGRPVHEPSGSFILIIFQRLNLKIEFRVAAT